MPRTLLWFGILIGGSLSLATVGCAETRSVSRDLREVVQVSSQPVEGGSPPAAEPVAPPSPAEIVIFSFEGSLEGWAIPDWAKGSSDHVGEEILVSQDYAKDGQSALEMEIRILLLGSDFVLKMYF